LAAPPNLETHNLLLGFYTRSRRDAFVDLTVQNIHHSNVRPNEYTCATVLHHYTKRNDSENFIKFIALMRGLNGGLMLANPKATINADSGGRLIRKENRPEKIIQKVYPTPMVYSAVIAGVLKFAGFERAVEICAEMNKDGWGLDIAGLSIFLSHAAYWKDWNAGLSVWAQIGRLAEKERKLRANFKLDEMAYVSILKLCASCGKENHFRLIFADAVKAGYETLRLNRFVLKREMRLDDRRHAKTEQLGGGADVSRKEEVLEEYYDEMVNERDAAREVLRKSTGSQNIADSRRSTSRLKVTAPLSRPLANKMAPNLAVSDEIVEWRPAPVSEDGVAYQIALS